MQVMALANTLAPAHAELRKLGFSVTRQPALGSLRSILRAERPGLVLEADDTLQLLGLATLVERRGEKWRPTDCEVDAFLGLES